MIGHIVLLRWRSASTADARCRVLEALRSLPEQISGIVAFDVVDDLGLGLPGGSADVAIVARFDDRAALQAYQDHSVHRDVVEQQILPLLDEAMSLQYTIDSGPTERRGPVAGGQGPPER